MFGREDESIPSDTSSALQLLLIVLIGFLTAAAVKKYGLDQSK